MTFSWTDKVAPEPVAQPMSLGDQYRTWQRAKSGGNGSSGSAIYDLPTLPEQRAAAAAKTRQTYETGPAYQGLESYSRVTRSKHLPRAGESDHAYIARLRSTGLEHLAESLPEDELAAVGEAYNAAVQRAEDPDLAKSVRRMSVNDYKQARGDLGLRENVDIGGGGVKFGYHGSSVIGNGIGIFDLSPDQRAAAWNARQRVTSQSHLSAPDSAPARPASMADVRQAIQAKEQAQRGQPVEHPDLSGLQSSAEGWLTR
jgi:hypothetical protein